jgi:hypothetical protein
MDLGHAEKAADLFYVRSQAVGQTELMRLEGFEHLCFRWASKPVSFKYGCGSIFVFFCRYYLY